MDIKLNVPNTLSFLRLLTIPFLIILILHAETNYTCLLTVYLFSMFLDFFDGFFARLLHQETEFGKIIDPLADKLMVFATVVALAIKTDFPLWLAIFVIARDLAIILASIILFKGRKKVQPSILVGKIAFALMGLLIMTFIIDLHPILDLEIIKRFLIPLCFMFISWSCIEYYGVYKRLKNANKKQR